MTTLPTSALMIHFKDYEQFHGNRNNELCHYVGVPTVTFSLVGLLGHIILWTPKIAVGGIFRLDLGLLLVVFGSLYYLRIDLQLAVPFILFNYLNYLLARHCSIPALIVIQVIGWIFQLIGHYAYEKKPPAFLTTLSHLFIGPMWVFAKLIGYYKS